MSGYATRATERCAMRAWANAIAWVASRIRVWTAARFTTWCVVAEQMSMRRASFVAAAAETCPWRGLAIVAEECGTVPTAVRLVGGPGAQTERFRRPQWQGLRCIAKRDSKRMTKPACALPTRWCRWIYISSRERSPQENRAPVRFLASHCDG